MTATSRLTHHPHPNGTTTLCTRWKAEEATTTLDPTACTCHKCADLWFGMVVADSAHMVPTSVLDGTAEHVIRPILDAAVLAAFGLCVGYLAANWGDVQAAIAMVIGG